MKQRRVMRGLCSMCRFIMVLIGFLTFYYAVAKVDIDTANSPDNIFQDYNIVGTNSSLTFESIWERDLSQYSNDANENNHNLFKCGNTLYCYVEHYDEKTKKNSIILRGFDIETGNEILSEIHLLYPFDVSYAKIMMNSDDNQNFIIAAISPNAAQSPGYEKIKVGIYQLSDENELTSIGIPIEYTRQAGVSTYLYHYYKSAFEWLDLSRDINNKISIELGCWHMYGTQPQSDTKFYPSKVVFECVSGTDTPEIHFIHYNENSECGLTCRNNTAGGDAPEGMLFSTVLPNGNHLVQGFGKSATNKTEHTRIMLYKNNGKTVENLSDAPILDCVDTLDDEQFVFKDPYCFGVFPVNIRNESLLILPYSYDTDNGMKFKVARWNMESFKSLEELWTFPQETLWPHANKWYDFLRPKVLVVNNDNQTQEENLRASSLPSAMIYAYMPGSGIGAYKVSIKDSTVSGIEDVADLQMNSGERARIYTATGHLLREQTVTGNRMEDVDLTGLSSGVYVVKYGNDVRKVSVN